MDPLSAIRRVTGNLDRALADFKTGNPAPLVKAIATCGNQLQAGLLTAIVCCHLKPDQCQDLLDALTAQALREADLEPFG
jgi:hypothetical protein